MTEVDRLLAECLKLEPSERARLIDELQASLPPDMGAVANEWLSDYRDEVVRRVRAVRDGGARLFSEEEFFARLKSSAKQQFGWLKLSDKEKEEILEDRIGDREKQ